MTQVTPNEVTTWTPIAASQTIVQLEGGCYFFGIRTSGTSCLIWTALYCVSIMGADNWLANIAGLGEAYFWGQGAYYQTMVDSTTNSFDLKKVGPNLKRFQCIHFQFMLSKQKGMLCFHYYQAMIPAGRKAVDLVIDTHCTVIRLGWHLDYHIWIFCHYLLSYYYTILHSFLFLIPYCLDDNTLFGGGFNLNKMHLSPINENAKYHILESVPVCPLQCLV